MKSPSSPAQRHEREALQACEEIARQAGATAVLAGYGSKSHLKVEFWRGGELLGTTTVSGSPKNRDQTLKAVRSDARKIVTGAFARVRA